MEKVISEFFEPFQIQYNKPFIMSDNGTHIVTGCANYGLICPYFSVFNEFNYDLEEMANYYLAHSIAFKDKDWYFGPGWYSYPLTPRYRGGCERYYSYYI
jgi:hypothetical protein